MCGTALSELRDYLHRARATVLYAVPSAIPERARALWTGEYGHEPRIRLVGAGNSHHVTLMDQPDDYRTEPHRFLVPAAAGDWKRE
jgi:hypothetical protein